MKQYSILLCLYIALFNVYAQKEKITIHVNDKVKFDMVFIKADTFIKKNYYGDTICHYSRLCPMVEERAYNGYNTIAISSYYIAKYEVTRELYYAIMHKDPSFFKKDPKNIYGVYNTSIKGPVETVSWYDAQIFIESLNKLTGKHFRLPTEAEWLYASYGGRQDFTYSGSNNPAEVAWKMRDSYPHNVGSKKPNGYGLYDMSGNVAEWCSDWFSADYYRPDTLYNNPIGPNTGKLKVIKGGSWGNFDRFLEVETRVGYNPNITSNGVGFRLAMDAE